MKILEKLSKLRAHADSARSLGNEAEAQAFAEKIQNLLIEHKLSMTDVELAELDREDPVREDYPDRQRCKRLGVRVRNVRVKWMEVIAMGVAHGHFCQMVVIPRSSMVSFVGRESDTEICHYMTLVLCRTGEELADKAYVDYYRQCEWLGDPALARGFRPNFLTGFSGRINERYYLKRKVSGNSSQALVRLNSSELAIEKWLQQPQYKSADRIQGKDLVNLVGFEQGREAGSKVSLEARAIEGESSLRLKGE